MWEPRLWAYRDTVVVAADARYRSYPQGTINWFGARPLTPHVLDQDGHWT